MCVDQAQLDGFCWGLSHNYFQVEAGWVWPSQMVSSLTSGASVRMAGTAGTAGDWLGFSTQPAWASSQHGRLRVLRLLTWWLASPRVGTPRGPEESARLLGLSFRSHMASHPPQFIGQQQITGLAHIHGKGPHKGVNGGRYHWKPALAIRNT